MRLARKVFHDLAIWMAIFGLSIGVIFPFSVIMLRVPRDRALTPSFFAACIAAGILTGVANYNLARWVVGVRLRLLARGMGHAEQNLQSMSYSKDLSQADRLRIAFWPKERCR